MIRNIHLTHTTFAIRSSVFALILSVLFTTACKKDSVVETAQANPNTTLATPAPADPQGLPAGGPGTMPVPSVPQVQPNGLPTLPVGAPTPAPGASPVPGTSPSPASSIRQLNGGKVLKVEGNQTIGDFVVPTPTPTPTPAATPVIEMVNGKIKQQWEAPAEFANLKSPIKFTPDAVKQGKQLYMQRCELCHGAEGKGNGAYNKPEFKQSTNLASKVVQANTDGELFYKVTNFRDRHPASAKIFTDEQRWMIVAFLRTFK